MGKRYCIYKDIFYLSYSPTVSCTDLVSLKFEICLPMCVVVTLAKACKTALQV